MAELSALKSFTTRIETVSIRLRFLESWIPSLGIHGPGLSAFEKFYYKSMNCLRRDDDLLESLASRYNVFHKTKMFGDASMIVSWTPSLGVQETWTFRFEKFYNMNRNCLRRDDDLLVSWPFNFKLYFHKFWNDVRSASRIVSWTPSLVIQDCVTVL